MPVNKTSDNADGLMSAVRHLLKSEVMMDYFVPAHIRGRFATAEQKAAAEAVGKDASAFGTPYEFFRGIHHIPDALADSHDANALGIVPVEEMSDDDWRKLGLDRGEWMDANRPQPEETVKAPQKPQGSDAAPSVIIKPQTDAKAPATA
jgi:hypothetical protein